MRRRHFYWTAAGLLFAVCLAVLPFVSASADDEELSYVGTDRCRMCHSAQHASWQEMAHSRAWETVAAEPDLELCVPCHTTGYGEPGGFTSIDETPNLANVGCEACHGPGSAHMAVPMTDREAKRATINQEGAFNCRRCHNPHVQDPAAAARENAED